LFTTTLCCCCIAPVCILRHHVALT
jgi:hypothetical protein